MSDHNNSIVIDIDDNTHVATLTLNRPEKLNSFTRTMHEALSRALDEIEGSHARALVITGAGRGFCAGQDLADLDFTPGAMTNLGALIDQHFNPLVRRLQASRLPVIAAVNGTAAGAGANLAMACDLIVAARSASFVQAFVKIGLVPDSGGTWLLPRRVGEARAMGLALTGDKLGAEQAHAWGLVWKVVDDADLPSAAQALAAQLAQQPAKAIAAIKHAIRAAANNTLDQQLDLERDVQRELGDSHDYAEGVAAFKEKRPPRFEGL
ncbi:2-(1,2-epoxy-1,2-dihydrophenyl)acetyl-CoA isomerase PaaG [Caballeronia sp. DA-9]|uniref:2-(1,2-epoxy-1,2-dihydrophenyl)acetyl-CoA isomerase PaaG n=1 Tax=Caballeronia sp. DA-9 TaxID=3436237 RepID=UPI003F66A7DE